MELIAVVYIVAAFIALGAGIPQIVQLVRMRNSDEFELGTWATWMLTQAVSLLYVISINNWLLIAVNIAWVSFYAVMVGLIIHFRPKNTWRFRLAHATASVTLEDK